METRRPAAFLGRSVAELTQPNGAVLGSDADAGLAQPMRRAMRKRVAGPCYEDYYTIIDENADGTIAKATGWLVPTCLWGPSAIPDHLDGLPNRQICDGLRFETKRDRSESAELERAVHHARLFRIFFLRARTKSRSLRACSDKRSRADSSFARHRGPVSQAVCHAAANSTGGFVARASMRVPA